MARNLWAGAAAVALVLAASAAWAKGSASSTPVSTPAPTSAPTNLPTAAPTVATTPVAKAAAAVPATGTAQSSGLTATVGSAKPGAVSGTAKPLSGTAKPAAVTGTAQSDADHKSPWLAHILAIVPGIAFHGVGHVYAGSYMKGFGLMVLEGACVGVGYNAVRIAVDNANAMNNGGGIPSNVSPYLTNGGVALVTGMGFLWTWWDDMAGSGIAVDEYNKRQDEAAASNAMHLQLLPAPGGAMLALSGRF